MIIYSKLWWSIWVNYNDLTATSLEIMVSKGNHPQMPYFRLVKYYFTQIVWWFMTMMIYDLWLYYNLWWFMTILLLELVVFLHHMAMFSERCEPGRELLGGNRSSPQATSHSHFPSLGSKDLFEQYIHIYIYIHIHIYIYIYIHIYIYINCLNNISCSKVLKSNGFSKHVWQWLHVVTSLEWWLGFGETSPSTPKWSLEFQQLSGCGFYCNSARLYVWFSLYICTYIHHIT